MKRRTNPEATYPVVGRKYHLAFFRWLEKGLEARLARDHYNKALIRHHGVFGFMFLHRHGPVLCLYFDNIRWQTIKENQQKACRTMPQRLAFINRHLKADVMTHPKWTFRDTVLLTAALNWKPDQ